MKKSGPEMMSVGASVWHKHWANYRICQCGNRVLSGFSKEGWNEVAKDEVGVCPQCGVSETNKTARIGVSRWVRTVKWYDPRTWGSGYWEERGVEKSDDRI